MAAPGGFRAERGQGVGLRIAELIQVDFCISRGGMKQVLTTQLSFRPHVVLSEMFHVLL